MTRRSANFSIAQRRPEPKPRRHFLFQEVAALALRTLNEGRSLNPGDTGSRAWCARAGPGTLNEGRSLNPGDTDRKSTPRPRSRRAQRRPEPKPRRHTPLARLEASLSAAQRRPEPKPRRHTAGTQSFDLILSALNEGRSLNPGDTGRRDRGAQRSSALNEGRSLNPGDTLGLQAPHRVRHRRSTKAGA